MNNETELHACPLCSGQDLKDLYRFAYPIVRCDDCGLVFVQKQPQVRQEEFYDEGYYRGSSEHKKNLDNENVLDPQRVSVRLESCRGVVEWVMQYHPVPGNWLDIGCGPGFLLSQAQVRGWRCTGIDASPFAPAFAREQFGLIDVRTVLIEEAGFPQESFDVISMQHVIEHFFDPLGRMHQVVGWLKPGGLLYIETPDIDSAVARRDGAAWEHIKLPEHVFYFSASTLRRLLAAIGCQVVEVRHPVRGTGLMNKLCGGEERARNFSDRWGRNPVFSRVARWVRWMRQKQLADEAEHIHMMARKNS